jgi:hypothetical protein
MKHRRHVMYPRRFLLFGGIDTHTFGGVNDLLRRVDSVAEGKQKAEELKLAWYHVVDSENMRIVDEKLVSVA